MTDKLELKSCHEVIDTVDVADVESIFHGKPIDPDILTVVMKDGKRLYCDEVCPVDSRQEEPVSGLDNGDMPIERWKQAVKAASNQRSYRSSKGLTETRDDYFVDGVQWADEHPKEEPVSEDLEEAADFYIKTHGEILGFGRQTFKAGAKWQKEQDQSTIELAEDHAMLAGMEKMREQMMENIWKPADGDDIPEIDKEVIALLDNGKVVFAHRPNPEGWDAKSIITEKVERYIPETYGKGGWNIPDVRYWLDCEIPKEMEE